MDEYEMTAHEYFGAAESLLASARDYAQRGDERAAECRSNMAAAHIAAAAYLRDSETNRRRALNRELS